MPAASCGCRRGIPKSQRHRVRANVSVERAPPSGVANGHPGAESHVCRSRRLLLCVPAIAVARADGRRHTTSTPDAIGSVRMTTDANGRDPAAARPTCRSAEEWQATAPAVRGSVCSRAKERDQTTGFDSFGGLYVRQRERAVYRPSMPAPRCCACSADEPAAFGIVTRTSAATRWRR